MTFWLMMIDASSYYVFKMFNSFRRYHQEVFFNEVLNFCWDLEHSRAIISQHTLAYNDVPYTKFGCKRYKNFKKQSFLFQILLLLLLLLQKDQQFRKI